MSEIVPVRRSSLAGGASTQPPHLRHADQVADAVNVLFEPDGTARKRPGTEYIAEIAAMVFDADHQLKAFGLDLGADGMFIGLIGRNVGDTSYTLEVFNLADGTRQTTTVQSAAQTYLNAHSPTYADFRVLTIAETTIILNTLEVPELDSSTDYTLTGTVEAYEHILSQNPADQAYFKTRTADEVYPIGHWRYILQDSSGNDTTDAGAGSAVTFPKAAFADLNADSSNASDWVNFNGGGGGAQVGGVFFFQYFKTRSDDHGNATFTTATKTLTIAGAFANLPADPAALGLQIQITGGTGVNADSYPIATKVSDDAITLVDDIGGTNPANVTFKDIGIETLIAASFATNDPVPGSMHEVAQRFEEGARKSNERLKDVRVAWVETSGITGHFEVTGPWRGVDGNSAAREVRLSDIDPTPGVSGTVNDGTDVANDAFYRGASWAAHPAASVPGWTQTNSTGDASTIGESYAPEERWVRVAAPGQENATLTATTMPVKLTKTGASTFTCDVIDWTDRLSGDQLTNPAPRVITEGNPITAMVFHRDRFCMGGDEFFGTSQAGDLFNVFAYDAINQQDSDPIDIEIGGNQVATIQSLTQFRNAVIALTNAGRQFELSAPDVLSPTTAAWTPSTREFTADVQPVALGSFVYFLTERGNHSALQEYLFDDTIVSNRANDVSSHYREQLPTDVKTLVSDAATSTIVVLGPEDSSNINDSLWVYKPFWNGGRKVQSAWARWDFDPTYRIVDLVALAGSVYMVAEVSNEYTIEKLPLSSEDPETGFPWTVHLDRRRTITGVHSTGTTTFDVAPLIASGSTYNLIVEGPDFSTPGTEVDISGGTYSGSDGDIDVTGDYSDGEVIIGRFYTMSLTLTRPYTDDGRGRPNLADRVTIRQTMVEYVDSGQFTITQTHPQSVDRTRTLDVADAGIATGVLSTLLGGLADDIEQTISDASARPVAISGIEYEVESTAGMRRG